MYCSSSPTTSTTFSAATAIRGQDAQHRSAGRARRAIRSRVLPVPAVWAQPQFDAHRPVSEQHRHPRLTPDFSADDPLAGQPAASVSPGRLFRGAARQAVSLRRARTRSAPTDMTIPVRGNWRLNPAGVDRLEEMPQTSRGFPASSAARSKLVRLAAERTPRTPTACWRQTPNGCWNVVRSKRIGHSFWASVSSGRTRRTSSPKSVFRSYSEEEMPVVRGVERRPGRHAACRTRQLQGTSNRARRRPAPPVRPGVLCEHQLHGRAGRSRRGDARSPRPGGTTRSSSSPATTAITWANTACGRR